MTKTMTTIIAGLAVSVATGCSVSGSWKRVATDPPQAMFPLESLDLDDNHNYTARWKHKGRKFGSTGTYQYRHGTLSIAESGRAARDYDARLRLDGKLELTYTINGNTITALLERKPQHHENQKQDTKSKEKNTHP